MATYMIFIGAGEIVDPTAMAAYQERAKLRRKAAPHRCLMVEGL